MGGEGGGRLGGGTGHKVGFGGSGQDRGELGEGVRFGAKPWEIGGSVMLGCWGMRVWGDVEGFGGSGGI